MNKLVVLQKRAVRIVDKANYFKCHTEPIYVKLKLLKVTDIYYYSCSLFLYKFRFNLLPEVCNSLLIMNTDTNVTYNLRHVYNFTIPSYRTSLCEKCLKIRGPKNGYSIPDDMKVIESLSVFKTRLRIVLIEKY